MAQLKLTVARLKKFGQTFELSIDPVKAVQFKQGKLADVHDAVFAEHIYSDAKKGQVAPQNILQKAFQTDDFSHIASIIIKEGELQLTQEQREEERERLRRRLIDLLANNTINPQTGVKHPPERIAAALRQGKISFEEHISLEKQLDRIISLLSSIIPLQKKGMK